MQRGFVAPYRVCCGHLLYYCASRGEFEAAGLEPFCYTKQGKSYRMSYHAAPEDALEDAELLRDWARKGVDAAFRSARGKPA